MARRDNYCAWGSQASRLGHFCDLPQFTVIGRPSERWADGGEWQVDFMTNDPLTGTSPGRQANRRFKASRSSGGGGPISIARHSIDPEGSVLRTVAPRSWLYFV